MPTDASHQTTVETFHTDEDQVRYAMWCDTCAAGGDHHPDPPTARADADAHATNPTADRPWAHATA